MNSKTNLKAVEPTPVEPADFIAARNLTDAVKALNVDSGARNVLSDADREALQAVLLLAAEFRAQAQQAAARTEPSDRLAEALEAEAKRYVRLSMGVQSIDIAGEIVESPSIESGAVRRLVEHCGENVVASAARYLENRTQEANAEIAKLRAWDEGVRVATTLPLLLAALDLLTAAIDAQAKHAGGALGSIQAASYAALTAACGIHSNELPPGINAYTLTEAVKRQRAIYLAREPKEVTHA